LVRPLLLREGRCKSGGRAPANYEGFDVDWGFRSSVEKLGRGVRVAAGSSQIGYAILKFEFDFAHLPHLPIDVIKSDTSFV
jgi:hypothetical protein